MHPHNFKITSIDIPGLAIIANPSAIETSAIRGFYKLTFNVYFQFKSDAMKEAVKTLRNLGYKVTVNQAEQILTISW